MNRWKVVLAALVIFLAGVTAGGMGMRLYASSAARPRQHRGPPGPPPMAGMAQRMDFMRRIQGKLDLTPAQQKRIDQILVESQERLRKLWEPIAPQAREEFDKVRKLIDAELTPEQHDKFDKLLREPGRQQGEPGQRKRWGRGEGPPSGQHPPGKGPEMLPPPDSRPH